MTAAYYYDGVRRIQTRTLDVPADPNYAAATRRDYVYGPGYVDEFAAVIDNADDPNAVTTFVLQDANFNVVALVDPNGVVLTQWQYTPYGEPIVRDDLDPNAPETAMGHQGLFFYRLDGDGTAAALTPASVGLYYNRARWYSPALGRFVQRDMNESGLPLPLGFTMHGFTPESAAPSLDVWLHLNDCLNLYCPGTGYPVRAQDPLACSALRVRYLHTLGLPTWPPIPPSTASQCWMRLGGSPASWRREISSSSCSPT